jgi:hypothetical protein
MSDPLIWSSNTSHMSTNTLHSSRAHGESDWEKLWNRESTTLFLWLTGSIATRLYPVMMQEAQKSGFSDIILHPTLWALPFFIETFVERHQQVIEILWLQSQAEYLQASTQQQDIRSHTLVKNYFAQISALLSTSTIPEYMTREIGQTIESYEDGHDIRWIIQKEKWHIKHIDIARKSRAILIAPATANTIAKIVYGITDNFLLEVIRATASDGSVPVFIAPAMNTEMLRDNYTQRNLDSLRTDGRPKYHLLSTQEKLLQCGEYGDGWLLNIREIFSKISDTIK